MKLEFVGEGSPDCPLIRLYDFSAAEAQRLLQIVLGLARKANTAVSLHAEQGIQPIGGCELTLRRADDSPGVRELRDRNFEWVFSDGGWLDVAGLIQPFCQEGAPRFQWLSRIGKISVLLSRDGHW